MRKIISQTSAILQTSAESEPDGGWWGQEWHCGSAEVTMATDEGTIQREREGDYVGKATELYNNCLCNGQAVKNK